MEEAAKLVTGYVSHAVEMIAAVIIGLAVIQLLKQYFSSVKINLHAFKKISWKGLGNPAVIRIQFGSAIALSLELLLGADVLATAVGPNWDDIGKLAAIAILRTALNYFLEKELKHLHSNHSNVGIASTD